MLQGGAVVFALFCALQGYTAATTQHYIDAEEICYRYYMKGVQGTPSREAGLADKAGRRI